VEDDCIGVTFLVPGERETLRISGRAAIVRDTRLNARPAHNGKGRGFGQRGPSRRDPWLSCRRGLAGGA